MRRKNFLSSTSCILYVYIRCDGDGNDTRHFTIVIKIFNKVAAGQLDGHEILLRIQRRREWGVGKLCKAFAGNGRICVDKMTDCSALCLPRFQRQMGRIGWIGRMERQRDRFWLSLNKYIYLLTMILQISCKNKKIKKFHGFVFCSQRQGRWVLL